MINKILKSKKDYEEACDRLYELMEARVEYGTKKGDESELLTLLIEEYETRNCPIDPPDPIDAIKFRMEQADLKQKDLAHLFGGPTRISEVLGGKRPLSLKMIYNLHTHLGIPYESLVKEPPEYGSKSKNRSKRKAKKLNIK